MSIATRRPWMVKSAGYYWCISRWMKHQHLAEMFFNRADAIKAARQNGGRLIRLVPRKAKSSKPPADPPTK